MREYTALVVNLVVVSFQFPHWKSKKLCIGQVTLESDTFLRSGVDEGVVDIVIYIGTGGVMNCLFLLCLLSLSLLFVAKI